MHYPSLCLYRQRRWLQQATICVVYTIARDIHVGVHGGHEIHNNVKVMSKEVKEKLSKLVLVDTPNTYNPKYVYNPKDVTKRHMFGY